MKTPFLKALKFSEDDFKSGKLLLELRIHVEEKCNLRCLYCLSDAPFMSEKKSEKRLSLDEIKKAIGDAKDLGAKTVSITGSGEPLLYKNLKEIIKYVHDLDLSPVLFSNSLILTPEFADFLYENNACLMLKLNSFKPEINDKLVGFQGAQNIFLERINTLIKKGFARENRLALNCIICNDNLTEIPDIFRFCRKNDIIPWIETVTITGRAKYDLTVEEDKIVKLYKHLSEIDKNEFGYEWEPDSPIVGADRRRYKYLCQVGLTGDVYHTDANITDKVGNIRKKELKELITSQKFLNLRDNDKHSRNYLDKIDVESVSEDVYRVLTNKQFRSVALPTDAVKIRIMGKISLHVGKKEPIQIFQFWGGCKNVNLGEDSVDLTEQATLNNLFRLNEEVKNVYEPGLKIFISPGDARVENVNYIEHKKTVLYVESLRKLAENNRYCGLFKVIPVSMLYEQYFEDFQSKLKEVRGRISSQLPKEEGFEKLVANARKNIDKKLSKNENEIQNKCILAAKEYVIHRVAEEEARIFRDYSECIRGFFIKYIPFYKKYLINIEQTTPNLDCSLVFFTGSKGNVTQPWQSIGKEEDGKIKFLSQGRLKISIK